MACKPPKRLLRFLVVKIGVMEVAMNPRVWSFQFLQPDLGRTGITGGLRLAARAAALGMEVVPHVSIAMAPQIAAAMHFAAAAPACHICEFNPAVVVIANGYSPQPIVMENARYIISESPGLGVSILEENLSRDIVR